jgi:hypothetical protein
MSKATVHSSSYQGEKAVEAANEILKAFQNPNELPEPLVQIFIRRKDNVPCRSWSWRNQLLVALHGYSDARGFRQWEKVGRRVKRGEKAFFILSPRMKTVEDEETGEEKSIIYGFKGTAVFGLCQTEGKKLPTHYPAVDKWISTLPLREVALEWGLSIEAYNGKNANYKGKYKHGKAIALGVKNLSTWAHELVHAADHCNGKLTELGQHWRSETVAELGGAVLLKLFGFDREADLGGCWAYIDSYAKKVEIDVIKACNRGL